MAEAEASGEAARRRPLRPLRLDLAEDPIGEAKRCLDLGARGIKLHPRAQRFLLNDERLEPVFALAAELSDAEKERTLARALETGPSGLCAASLM